MSLKVGSIVESSASAGIFSARASASAKPASVVSLGFTVGQKSWILEVPVSAVTFIQSDTEKSSVRMVLADTMIYGGIKPMACHFHNLFLVCPREGKVIEPSKDLARKGLPPIVSEHLDSAVITLTPAMYRDLLGLP